MANLVSPGVSVTVTDESFFVPAAAATVPLIFVASADEKKQPDGISDAAGTFEHNVVRTVTSLQQSTQLYGIPRFIEDLSGNPFHGDARNEYGLLALNQFLGVGNRAFVVRANVNLNDDLDDVRASWVAKMDTAATTLESLVTAFIDEFNTTNGFIPSDPDYKVTVTSAEFLSLAHEATAEVWDSFSFRNLEDDFFDDQTSSPLDVFADGYSAPATGTFVGVEGLAAAWVSGSLGSTTGFEDEWTAAEAATTLTNAATPFQFTVPFLNKTSLGANDAARRSAIVTALQAAINSNTEVRSENFEYNLVLCPGYPEVVDEMLTLVTDIGNEALVVADTPMDLSPEDVVTWADSNSRFHSTDVAYYYSHGLTSNLDGKTVLGAASGVALRTIAFSDNVSQIWFAPAGTRRGLVTGVSLMGYVSGTLGTATEFVEANLNVGQRDDLYKYFTNVNPITFIPGRGILVFGQKTSASDASAMDRVNVSRLIKYIKRQLRKSAYSFLFEPNDQLTRDSLKAVVDGFLGNILVQRGLYDFVTVCDDSNNTPDRIDRNELFIDVALKPVKAAEFIYIPIRIVATGTQI